MKFIDEVRITAASGPGGHGACTFRREKFVPKGGPSGGDGGQGGDVVFVADGSDNTLQRLRFKRVIQAAKGGNGDGSNKTGPSGDDAVVPVPIGTLIKDARTGEVLADLTDEGQRITLLAGGRGGRGNARFVSSTNQAPTRCDPGEPGQTRDLLLELKLLADVGLLGLPNAGKSTFISRVSAARPKVAAYPFTTLEPMLGVVGVPGTWRSFVIADIPGLAYGAAEGVGLGHRFLRHVERCALLLHLVSLDPLEDEGAGPALDRFARINAELAKYDADLARRPQVVLLSKCDLVSEERRAEVVAGFAAQGQRVLVGSAVTGEGIDAVVFALAAEVDAARGVTPR